MKIQAMCKEAMELHIRGLSKTYYNGFHALKNVMLITSNGMYGLLRLNSAGKSTLMRFYFLVLAVVIALVVSTTTYAQDKMNEIDKIFSWATPATPGCVCAVSQNGKVIVNRAYGLADLERDVPLSTNSIFDAGSVRKQFVAAAVLLLVEDGKLSLSDDVRKHIPQLPDYGHKITLDHLLTHTSGIRDWQPLLNLAGGDPDARTMILRQRGLNFSPGEEWSYSNSGYVLLPEIVARTSGMSFSEFTRKRLFEPLGMKITTYVDDMTHVIKNRALAYGKEKDHWKVDMYLGNDRGGAGALMSTPTDLLIWNDALTNNRLGTFVTEKLQEQAKLNNGRKLSYTRGLTVEPYRSTSIMSHSGGAAGYHSWLGRLPEQGLSIAVMCNSDAMAATALAYRVIDVFLPTASLSAAAPEAGPPPAIPADALPEVNSKAGLFFSEQTGEQMRLAVDRGRFRIAGGPGLVHVAKDRFRRWGAFVEFMSQDKFELNFLSPDKFELKSMEGKVTRYARALPYAPTATELQAFAGRYQSDELMAVFEMTPGKDGLMGRANDRPGPPFEFKPVDRDTFQFAGIILRFVRDKAGKVVGLDFSNPVLRKVKFTRLSDRTNRGR
ncbi:MAG: serine hydrolase [Bacteroidota bacterium]|nr:serine hydrolase [Bacteroidota bacterium]